VDEHVLLYDDALEFGGHEAMLLAAARSLLDCGYRLTCMYSSSNGRFEERLRRLATPDARLALLPVAYGSGRLQGLRTLLSPRQVGRMARVIRSLAAQWVVVGQGRIETSSLGLLAAKRAGCTTISYIAMAHGVATMTGPGLVATATDLANRLLYRAPHRFITVSQAMAAELRTRGARQTISVVPNGIDLATHPFVDRAEARARYGIPKRAYVVAVVGRVQFRQKGHDFMLEAVARHRRSVSDVCVLVVGDGPDLDRLRGLIKAHRLADVVTIAPWTDDLATVYSMVDMVAMPSRFEGLPLVALEAMHYGLPIVGSRIDAMSEILPDEWLFEPDQAESFVKTICRVRSADNQPHIARHKRLITERHSLERFGRTFRDALLGGPMPAQAPASSRP
jgi:glycosyltransferase involved in cell wall biosynthesis